MSIQTPATHQSRIGFLTDHSVRQVEASSKGRSGRSSISQKQVWLPWFFDIPSEKGWSCFSKFFAGKF